MIQLDRWLQKQKQTKSNIRTEKQKLTDALGFLLLS